ncbi:hypothetical protein CBS101457_005998 [Exobasidium rhododendri]|nr:hypothetical protein CBS101457_005998 [Exobasidium rhododendri]
MKISTLASSSALAVTLASSLVGAATWNLTDTIAPNDFETAFDWFNATDPTNGLVLYQTLAEATAANLSVVSNDQFVMSVDTTEVQLAGRKSIRITSKKSYSDGVYVLNVAHVPTGCSVWPAFWTVTDDLDSWPIGGEIDITENANDQFPGALSSLHTSSSCTIPSTISAQTGTVQYTNCSAYTEGNSGCRSELSSSSWGTTLNNAGGGTFAMERSLGTTGNGVRVWFWTKGNEPTDLASGSSSVNPDSWGSPGADFDVASSCNADFGPHNIVFDITLCGDWAGNTYNSSGCNAQYPTCSYQVGYNGSSYNQSYWAINDLRVFATGGGDDNAANSPFSTSTSSSSKTSGARRSIKSGLDALIPIQIATILIATLAFFASVTIA